MFKKAVGYLSNALICATVFGQASAKSTPNNEESALQQIKESVVFIQGSFSKTIEKSVEKGCTEDIKNPKLETCFESGTGYLIGIPEPRLSATAIVFFLVTNLHVLREPGPDGTQGGGAYLKKVDVRFNAIQPVNGTGDQFIWKSLSVLGKQGELLAFTDSADTETDLALLSISLNEQINYRLITPEYFATAEKIGTEKIDENTEILFAGLFASYPGAKKNYPIVRHGKLALISDERIPWKKDSLQDLYLADVMSFGGNSGSPVVARLDRNSSGQLTAQPRYFLLGTMQGYFPVIHRLQSRRPQRMVRQKKILE